VFGAVSLRGFTKIPCDGYIYIIELNQRTKLTIEIIEFFAELFFEEI